MSTACSACHEAQGSRLSGRHGSSIWQGPGPPFIPTSPSLSAADVRSKLSHHYWESPLVCSGGGVYVPPLLAPYSLYSHLKPPHDSRVIFCKPGMGDFLRNSETILFLLHLLLEKNFLSISPTHEHVVGFSFYTHTLWNSPQVWTGKPESYHPQLPMESGENLQRVKPISVTS